MGTRAYILIETQVGMSRNVAASLRSFDKVMNVDVITGPFDVIAAAGKSPGEIALYWDERKILIVGDAVIGNPPGACALLPERVMDDPARLRGSVRELLALDFDILLFGDGVAILEDAKARLQELVETFTE